MTITFFKMAAAYHERRCWDNLCTIDATKSLKNKSREKDLTKNLFKVKFFKSCDVFVFYKNLLCLLRSLCLRHDINNGV